MKMVSKTKVMKRIRKKSDDYVVQTTLAAGKNAEWMKIAQKVSGARRAYDSINLKKIEEESNEGDTVIVIGKVLSSGNLSKKLRICALYFSEGAREKIEKSKGDAVDLLDEIKKNPKAQGVKIIGLK